MADYQYIVGGTQVMPRINKVRTYPDDRQCSNADCITKLSRYNKSNFCYYHQPIKRPRLRGKMPSEKMEEGATYRRCQSCSQRFRHWRERIGEDPPVVEVLFEDVIHREGRNGYATLCEAA